MARNKVKSRRGSGKHEQGGATAPMPAEERDRRLYQAALAYQAGRYAEAEAAAHELRAAVPDFFPVLLLLGMTAHRTGKWAEGVELLRAAVSLDVRSVEARSELATLLRAMGRHAEAIAAAGHALRLKPDDAGNHNNLGLAYLAAGRAPAAITHFGRALALQPTAPVFHFNLGLALQQQSRDLEATAAFQRALALDPGHAEAHARLGQLLFQHGQPEDAARCYERAAALQPHTAIAAVQRAEALIQQGRAVDAEAGLRAALTAEPGSDLLHEVLGVLLQRLGRFDGAGASFERALELQPKRVSSYQALVRGKRIEAHDAAIVARMEELLRAGGLAARDRSSLHFTLGKAYEDLGEYRRAIGHFDKANALEKERLRDTGRWFDRAARAAFVERTIADFGADCFARHPAGGSESELPVLIVGMPRSGTSLIEQILSSHPAIGAAGELSYWTDRPLSGMPASGAPGDMDLGRLAEGYLALLRRAAPAARRVTDKMPANFLVLGLIHLVLPRARVIHCRRNALDTCLSIYTTPFGNPLDFAHDRGNLVFYYQQYLRLMAHWRQVIPRALLLEIDYERLVAEPEPVTRAMLDFCGLEWDEACLRHDRNRHVIMTPSVWQARQPIYRNSVERWRRYEPWLGQLKRLLPGE